MKYKVTNNTPSDITLTDLAGKVIPNDAIDLDLLLNNEFAIEDLFRSNDLQSNISSGDLTAKDEFGNKISLLCAASYKSLLSYMDVSGTVTLSNYGTSISSHHIKVNGTTTLNLDNIPSGAPVYIMIEQDATGGHTITLPTFDNLDTQPVITTTAGKMDVLIVMKMGSGIHLHSLVKHTDTF